MVTSDRIEEAMNIKGITFKVSKSFENKSKTKICSFKVFHKLNIKINPPEITAAKNKYMVCILCIIP